MPPMVPSTPRSKVVGAVVVLHEEVGEHRHGEQAEAHAPANATITVLSVRICHSRANAASIEIGAGCSSSMTSPSTSCFSNWPRGGSGSRNAEDAAIAAGMPSSRNGHRQPSSPPARGRDAGDEDRAEHADDARPHRQRRADAATDADRVRVGDHATPAPVVVFDFATPTPSRAQNSWNAFVTRPHSDEEDRRTRGSPSR